MSRSCGTVFTLDKCAVPGSGHLRDLDCGPHLAITSGVNIDLLPRNHEIVAVWRRDAPAGQAWKCPDCDLRSTRGSNAAHHAMQADHQLPVLVAHAPPKKAGPLPGVRIGDAMQVMDDLRLAMAIAESSLLLAQVSGANPKSLLPLQLAYDRLRRLVNERHDAAVAA